MPLAINCHGHLASLAKSPTFVMSLGAKELFHTNFLAFLLESREPSIQPIQSKLKTLFFGHGKVGRVVTWREKNSLDLVIMPAPKTNGNTEEAELDYNCSCDKCNNNAAGKSYKYCHTIAVVIEAKLKSIPTHQQLDDYDKKLIAGVDFELDDVDTVDARVNGKQSIQVRTWQVMKLKLRNDGGMRTCSSNCTIYARGKISSAGETKVNSREINKFDGTVRRLLLLPLSLSPSHSNPLGCWDKMSWKHVVDALRCCRQQGNPCQPLPGTINIPNCTATDLLSRIICDYRDSLEQLLAIIDKTEAHVKQSVISASTSAYSYNDYYKPITAPKFKAHRIHDLVGKYASHVLERHVMDIICPALASAAGHGTGCAGNCAVRSSLAGQLAPPAPNGVCDYDFRLNSYTHFSNQQPGVGFEWLTTKKIGNETKDRKLSFGVQIQGIDYRHFICATGGASGQAKHVLDELEKTLGIGTAGWFQNTGAIFRTVSLPPFRLKTTGGFFVFGKDVFRYSKAGIGDFPMADLAQAVCRSLCWAIKIVDNPRSNDLGDAIKKFFPENEK